MRHLVHRDLALVLPWWAWQFNALSTSTACLFAVLAYLFSKCHVNGSEQVWAQARALSVVPDVSAMTPEERAQAKTSLATACALMCTTAEISVA